MLSRNLSEQILNMLPEILSQVKTDGLKSMGTKFPSTAISLLFQPH
jgi:hypothetical protein